MAGGHQRTRTYNQNTVVTVTAAFYKCFPFRKFQLIGVTQHFETDRTMDS